MVPKFFNKGDVKMNYQATYIKANEEFNKLTKQDKELCRMLSDSTPIYHFIHDGCYDDANVIMNFKVIEEEDRKYFEFNIADPLAPISNPNLIYKIKGSILDYHNGKNIIYTSKFAKDSKILKIHLDKITNITDKIILREVSYIDPYLHKNKIESVMVKIQNSKATHNEFLLIDPNSEIYKLYLKGEIDITTLCNLAFYQSLENKTTKTITDNSVVCTKKLAKSFCERHKR